MLQLLVSLFTDSPSAVGVVHRQSFNESCLNCFDILIWTKDVLIEEDCYQAKHIVNYEAHRPDHMVVVHWAMLWQIPFDAWYYYC